MLSSLGGKARRFLCGGTLTAAMALATIAHADVVQNNDFLPAATYESNSTVTFDSGAHKLSHLKFTMTTPGQISPATFPSSTFFDVFVDLTLDDISYTAAAPFVTVNFTTISPGEYDMELTSLDISGGSLLPTLALRESPTLASDGHTSVTGPDFSGHFHIDSFFDIFTELSIDGGATWTPTDGGAKVQSIAVPEPASLCMMGIGMLALVRRRR